MIDLLVEVHLRDRYVIIHRAAVTVLRFCKFSKDRRGYIALETLLILEEHYFNEGTDTRFLEELVGVLQWSFPDWLEVRRHIVLNLLPKYAAHTDTYFSEHMLSTLSRYVDDFPEVSRVFLQATLNFFARSERDRYNYDGHSTRRHLWEKLSDLPADVISSEYELFAAVVKSKALADPNEAYRFISIFSTMELHEQAGELAAMAYDALPAVKAHARWKETFRQVATAERVEALLSAHDQEGALTLLRSFEAKDLQSG
jgi:hypothetical protein